MPFQRNQVDELSSKGEAIVRRAGEIVHKHWDRPKNVQYKGRIDLVTETDTAVEDYLTRELSLLLPKARIVAEERAGDVDPGDLAWIIDPLDGTTNFAHGLPHVAVSVGLWGKGRMIMGFIHVPKLNEFFSAVRGRGAFLNGRPITVADAARLDATVVATGFPYSVAEDLDQILPPLRRVLEATRGIRRLGAAAVDLAYTACGRFGGFYEYGLKPWDTAAGWLLVEEAGGKVTRTDGTTPYGFDSPAILATNGTLHAALAEAVEGEVLGK